MDTDTIESNSKIQKAGL